MSHYYYFVRNLNNFGINDVVFLVRVGDSQREQIKLALLREYCKDCGFYLRIRGEESDKAIEMLRGSVYKGWNYLFSPLKVAQLSISQLYRLILDDSIGAYEKSLVQTRFSYNFRRKIDPNFLFSQYSKKNVIRPATGTRKNLKSGQGIDAFGAVFGFALILAVFLLVAWLEGTVQY